MSGVLIVAEHRRGELRPVTLELVAAAQAVKRATSDTVAVALIGDDPEALVAAVSLAGVDEILTVNTAVGDFDPEVYEAMTRSLIAERRPYCVLVPHSIDSFGYAAALAARGGAEGYGFATDVFKMERRQGELLVTRGGYGQKVNVEVDFPGKSTVLLAVRGGVFEPPEAPANPLVTPTAAPPVRSRSRSRAFVDVTSTDEVDIASAPFILSIGRGIGEQARVEDFIHLADSLGATLGCSRPIADAGWLAKSRQIGQSGKTASACRLYVAMGISGAIQHLAGMKHVPTVVAVNADEKASIFSVARYGIVADIFEIAEALRAHFR